ncbi:MAG: hypothetical protein V1769_04755 [Thermoplasmatota archaeon]
MMQATNMGREVLLVLADCYHDWFDSRRDDFQETTLGITGFYMIFDLVLLSNQYGREVVVERGKRDIFAF